MEINRRLQSFKEHKGFEILTIVLVSGALLILSNYFTSKMTSSIRAYIHGESEYSKGQKDASQMLILYILYHEEYYYEKFQESIDIPLSDSRAHDMLRNGGDEAEIRKDFIQANNHPEDVDRMIWLYKNFQQVEIVQESIKLWQEADVMVRALDELGLEVREDLLSSDEELSDEAIDGFLVQINKLSYDLTIKESQFSTKLSILARRVSGLLLFINLFSILIILISSALFSLRLIKSLHASRQDLKRKNKKLRDSNKKLDQFLYASSHDLKSPISNLEGLIHIFQLMPEEEKAKRADLISKMLFSIDTLRGTIGNIENLMRDGRASGSESDIKVLIFDEVLEKIKRENEVSFKLDSLQIEKDFQVKKIRFSRIALKSILYNLLSNAVKYRAEGRPAIIRLSTHTENEGVVFIIRDNGVGIDLDKHGAKMFTMFKRFHDHVEGSGLGLFAVKEVVEKYGGSISVESEVNKGTTFKVFLPELAEDAYSN